MRKFNVVGLCLRKEVRTTIPEPAAPRVPDLLRRDPTPGTWVTPPTCLSGCQYPCLAMALGIPSKRLVSRSITDHIRTSVVAGALKAAAAARPTPAHRLPGKADYGTEP
jgi:hypothetical protein